MAAKENGELEIPGLDRPLNANDFRWLQWFRVMRVPLLLISGFLLVAFSSSLGFLLVQNCSLPGICIASNDAAETAATTCRFLGVMLFVVGVVERVLMALVKPKEE